jgi:hypothetical protein
MQELGKIIDYVRQANYTVMQELIQFWIWKKTL